MAAGVSGVEQLREMKYAALTSVARRADNRDCRSHSEYVVRKQMVKLGKLQ
jgi:hypothetical protein